MKQMIVHDGVHIFSDVLSRTLEINFHVIKPISTSTWHHARPAAAGTDSVTAVPTDPSPHTRSDSFWGQGLTYFISVCERMQVVGLAVDTDK